MPRGLCRQKVDVWLHADSLRLDLTPGNASRDPIKPPDISTLQLIS